MKHIFCQRGNRLPVGDKIALAIARTLLNPTCESVVHADHEVRVFREDLFGILQIGYGIHIPLYVDFPGVVRFATLAGAILRAIE